MVARPPCGMQSDHFQSIRRGPGVVATYRLIFATKDVYEIVSKNCDCICDTGTGWLDCTRAGSSSSADCHDITGL
jgi:hypothetical protein